jgi:ATP-binding cassette, subfamily B, bacterial PglK
LRRLRKTLGELLPLLPAKARRFFAFFATTSAVLALLDSFAIAILTVSLTQVIAGSTVTIPVIGALPQSWLVPMLAAAAGLMILKAALNILLQWFATRRFAEYEQEIGGQLFRAYIRAPWTERLKRSSPEIVRMVDVGIANTITGVITPVATIPTHLVTFGSILLVILVAQPATALVTVIYFGMIALVMQVWITRKSYEAGSVNRRSGARMVSLITEMITALKEITLRDKADEVGETVFRYRREAAVSRSNIRFLGSVPKFIVDIALIGGVVLVGGISYVTGGTQNALVAVAVFAIGGFRMVPAITGLQAQMNQISAALPHADAVVRDIHSARSYLDHAEQVGTDPIDWEPTSLDLADVTFTYPGAEGPALSGATVSIPMGSTLGIVGASGAGKSTIVDLVLGLLTPSGGSITLDGRDVTSILASWRRKVGYVPQDVAIFDGTVAQNVALTWSDDIDLEKVTSALERAQLLETVLARPSGLDERVGERGLAFSGGQRQRLGIARALYAEPLVLVLDEATSALDTATEAAVATAIRGLEGELTVISVAHRLSTIRSYDQIAFMQDGRIESLGTFDEVVRESREFALQATLAGLHPDLKA